MVRLLLPPRFRTGNDCGIIPVRLPSAKHVMPWRVEDELKSIGANYVQAGLWRGFAVRDGNLITGQQNFSGAETADAVIRALGE